MLEWTGERFLPWIEDATIAYEHLHRYAYASQFVAGAVVLDLGSGEGYGASLLARTASAVIGVDVDPESVSHAQRKYTRPNLDFVAASAMQIPFVDPIDVVVCFETLEHIDDQHDLIREAKRLLKPEGLLIISTPDKRTYSDEPHADNPFHTRELYFEEFRELLGTHFNAVRFIGQRVYCNSNMWPIEQSGDNELAEFFIKRTESEFQIFESPDRVPIYYIALASDSDGPLAASRSLLVDSSNEFIRQAKAVETEIRDIVQERQEALAWKQSQIQALEAALGSRDTALEWKQSQIQSLEESNREYQSAVTSFETEWDKAAAYMKSLEESIRQKDEYIGTIEGQLQTKTREADSAAWELVQIKATRGWALLERLRGDTSCLFRLLRSDTVLNSFVLIRSFSLL